MIYPLIFLKFFWLLYLRTQFKQQVSLFFMVYTSCHLHIYLDVTFSTLCFHHAVIDFVLLCTICCNLFQFYGGVYGIGKSFLMQHIVNFSFTVANIIRPKNLLFSFCLYWCSWGGSLDFKLSDFGGYNRASKEPFGTQVLHECLCKENTFKSLVSTIFIMVKILLCLLVMHMYLWSKCMTSYSLCK